MHARAIMAMAGILVLSALPSTLHAAGVHVMTTVPPRVDPGTRFEMPVVIRDGGDDVVSYAFRLRFNRRVLKVVEIRGGTFPGFAANPVVDRRGFERGRTDFTATSPDLLATPDALNVATIVFEVVGRRGTRSAITLRKVPRSDLTLRRGFGPARSVSFSDATRSVVVR